MEKAADSGESDAEANDDHGTHPSRGYTLDPGFDANSGECIAYLAILVHIVCILYAIGFVKGVNGLQPAWLRKSASRSLGLYQGCNKHPRAHSILVPRTSNATHRSILDFLGLLNAKRRSVTENSLIWSYLESRLRNIVMQVPNDDLPKLSGMLKYNSFVHLMDDNNLISQIEQLLKRRNDSMLLFGEPIVVKDNLAIRDVPYSNGSNLLQGYAPSYTARAVELLQHHGALLIGKTAMDEFGVGASTDAALNPYSSKHVAGGSSGGSATAVAGGIVNIAIGTDTGGSIRLPAAYCGCIGYRPSYGLISRQGLSELAGRFDTVGICTRNVDDCIKTLLCIIDEITQDCTDSKASSKVILDLKSMLHNKDTLKQLKVASLDTEILVSKGLLDPEMADNIRKVELNLSKLGVNVVKVPPPELAKIARSYHIYVAAQMASNLQRFADMQYHTQQQHMSTEDMMSQMYPDTRARMQGGVDILQQGYDHENIFKETRDYIHGWMNKHSIFTDLSIMLSPTSAHQAPLKRKTQRDCIKEDLYTTLAPFIGACAIAIPTGMGKDGLPLSAQFTSARFQDALLLEAARAYLDHAGNLIPTN
ncbi:amidase family protein [Babesia bovis T2Bo]|uniref:Amidase family protein n=1 Tax=Babesia bovis TaxID=5865 RepID=A7APP8_BABBO|nr:amidase family protein [Babesia bovis T2Bo]EDO08532.1 amidase family protein [Babesia bovis T2Bo]|eukprot:XP_001612100.1 amidase family protein [Babesia bovis T2Bo]